MESIKKDKNQESSVYLICAVHNNLQYTKKLLECLDKSDYHHVYPIIVDDGSTDGTESYIKKHYPDIKIIKGNGNLWWTGSIKLAINQALNCSKVTDFVITINNDCIFSSTYIGSLVKLAKENNKSIIGSLVLDSKTNKIVDSGVKINWKSAVFVPILKLDNKISNKLIKVDTLSTKGTIFPIDVFYKIGNFDDKNFPHYLSDYEFTCRAKRGGYELYMTYELVVYNDSSRTGNEIRNNKHISTPNLLDYLFSKKSKINITDQFRFFYKYCPNDFKLSCYLSLFKKGLYLLSITYPFSKLRGCVGKRISSV